MNMFRLSLDCEESEESLDRRARVIVYRLANGENIDLPAWDPVTERVFERLRAYRTSGGTEGGFRVPHGAAANAIPGAL